MAEITQKIVSVRIRGLAVGGEGVGEVIDQHDNQPGLLGGCDTGSILSPSLVERKLPVGAGFKPALTNEERSNLPFCQDRPKTGLFHSLLGITAFVPFTAPGELVRAAIKEEKDRYLKAELLEIIEASAERITPPCKLFKVCGGCDLQHMSKSSQLEAKQAMLLGALQAARLPARVLTKLEPIISGPDYGYRRRITLHADSSGRIGFYRSFTRSVIPVSNCPVASPKINQMLTDIQTLGAKIQGQISSITLEDDLQGIIAVLKSPYDLSPSAAEQIIITAKEYFPDCSLVGAEKEILGHGRRILELPLNRKQTFFLRVPAGSFSQVNWNINLALIAKVIEESQITTRLKAYDLYAGAGNFALPLALAGAEVTAVECDPLLVKFGKENAARYNLKINFTGKSVEKFIEALTPVSNGGQTIPLVVADPPRSGLGHLANKLHFAKKLLLISCHQPSFIRDAKNLCEAGWEIKKIIPFEMFPQTSYLEILGVFER